MSRAGLLHLHSLFSCDLTCSLVANGFCHFPQALQGKDALYCAWNRAGLTASARRSALTCHGTLCWGWKCRLLVGTGGAGSHSLHGPQGVLDNKMSCQEGRGFPEEANQSHSVASGWGGGVQDPSLYPLTWALLAGWLSLESSSPALADQTEGARHVLGRPR